MIFKVKKMLTTNVSSSRAAKIEGLKTIRCPKEGGNKKEYDDILEEIDKHVSVAWTHGLDLSHWLSEDAEVPNMEEPKDLTPKDNAVQWKKRLWN